MNLTWRTHILNVVLLLALLLPAGMTTQAAPAVTQTAFDCSAVTEIPQAECEALVALYESTSGTTWANNTGWLATNTPCSWHGITCSGGNVSDLSLPNNQLSGPIPPEIGDFTSLTWLNLSRNQLSGPILPEISNLTALTGLHLDNNRLNGFILPELGNLVQLKWLFLSNNQLSGSIPFEIGNLTALETLVLNSNQLSGPIPSQIGNLTALRSLWLSSNQLSSQIPSEIGDLTALTFLELSSNQLNGAIPREMGNLTALTQLRLNNNQLTSLPSEIGNLAALTALHLSENQLTSLPPEIGDLASLTWLWLDNNQLTNLPPEIGNLQALEGLLLRGNQLSAPIPPEFGDLTALTSLYLSGNQLTSLPPEIGNITTLSGLDLGENQFSSLPPEIGDLSTLRALTIYDNPLSGELPAFLTQLTQLTWFTFYNTDLCVPLPSDKYTWLGGVSTVYGTGLICDLDPGSLSGAVTLPNTTPATGIQVNLYRSLSANRWPLIATTQTAVNGTYQFTGLGQGLGINYRVQFVDPAHQLAPQYYEAKPTIGAATIITITPGVPGTGIDAVLALPQPPAVSVETASGSVVYTPDGAAQITMPASIPSDVTLTREVTCTTGTPSTVTLKLSTGPQYPMANVGDDLYRATIPAAALTGNVTLRIAATCNGATTESTVGYVTLYDPSGIVTDAQTEQPVESATVTLYQVPGWLPKTGPDDDRPNTCESNLSKAPDAPWSQPAPIDLGIIANADVTPTVPRLPYQHTTAAGYYGWDVSEGCWYVTVEAEGYQSLVSPVVGVPPEVIDLDLALTPLTGACPAPLAGVDIVGPLGVTSTLYINTLYTFEAVIIPTNATAPITYTWTPTPETGQGTSQATYRWNTPDTYTVTLTAENCGGTFSSTHAVVIEYKDTFAVYLPLVLRQP